jgi:hypothetical protein
MTGSAAAAARSRLASPATATVLVSAAAALLGVILVMAAVTHSLTLSSLQAVSGLLAMIAVIAAVGLVVARHQPGNPIGWLLLTIPLWLLLVLACGAVSTFSYRAGRPGLPVIGPVALVLAEQFPATLIPFPLVILLFPDGRLPSPRWRWPLRIYLVLAAAAPLTIAAVTIGAVAGHHVTVTADGYLASVEHPSGGTAFLAALGPAFILTVAVFWLCAVGRQVASWRRASGERRQQLKWLASGAAVCGICGVSAVATNSALWEVLIVGFAALPVAIGVGILKYRLYDIDRIISRTLAYALVTALLVGVYAGLVTLASVLVGSSSLAVALSTLVVAALFNPLRRRVQHAVDRRFNRARYDGDTAIAAFAARLQGTTDLDAAHADLLTTVRTALEPASLSVWFTASGP